MVRKTKIHILCTTFLLAAGGAGASSLPPVAALDSNAQLTFSAQGGLSVVGDLIAQYRAPTGGPKRYIFNTALDVGPAQLTPNITLVTNEIQIIPDTVIPGGCFPFVGCLPPTVIPGISIPAQNLTFDVPVPLLGSTNVYDATYVSPELPLGAIFGFDYGTPLFGFPLSFGDLVQDQFETGDTTVSVAGGVGPFGASFDYDGELQPGNDTILATYALTATGPGILGEIEAFALGFLNDNASDLLGAAYDLVVGGNPCGTLFGLSGGVASTCNTILAGLDPEDLIGGFSINSLGAFTADLTVSKSITPVPLPAAGLLLLGGLGAFGIAARRQRRKAA